MSPCFCFSGSSVEIAPAHGRLFRVVFLQDMPCFDGVPTISIYYIISMSVRIRAVSIIQIIQKYLQHSIFLGRRIFMPSQVSKNYCLYFIVFQMSGWYTIHI